MPVNVRCVVKRIPSSVLFLSWRCSKEKTEENLVLCNPILDFSCEFGEVVNVTGSCECDNSVIVSKATFVSKSDGADTGSLTCSNGREEETVSVTANGETNKVIFKFKNGEYRHGKKNMRQDRFCV